VCPIDDRSKVLEIISSNPGLYQSQIINLVGLPLNRVEDAIWELWSGGQIQIENDSTLRSVRDGEKVFRHFAP
jgi:hypothetical protein